jgi:uncharacterized protein YgbK (DUF1537 family)
MAGVAFSGVRGPGIVLSGSCSVASRNQLAHYMKTHPGFMIEPEALLGGATTVEQAIAFARAHRDAMPVIYSTADPQQSSVAQERFGRERVASTIEHFFGRLAQELVADGVRRLAIGGGETSGAVVTALGLDYFVIGPEIDPGVPALAASGKDGDIRLALKSGNFGALDFYDRALNMLEAV